MAGYDRKDSSYRRAKNEGYRSRAAYKLIELDRRFQLLKRNQRVVDLGCWPGAWLQFAAQKTGPGGRVIGVDLAETAPLGGGHVHTILGDVTDPAIVARVADALGSPADLVLSDLAPKLSGVKASDAARHTALVEVAIERARQWLQPEGSLVVKLFMGPDYQTLISRLREVFKRVRSVKLDTTRQGSSELYTCARILRSDGKESRPGDS